MAQLMSRIELVMIEWRAFRINNRQAYEQIERLILDYQRETWNYNHQ